jgi:hypothetical protein
MRKYDDVSQRKKGENPSGGFLVRALVVVVV